mmetsp:Transcript_53048/g.143137  ORF Transcript_53048/g.143137 Transcript_53048/m.143137 type:complete len:184 (-) Transcript_53048:8-559(-)
MVPSLGLGVFGVATSTCDNFGDGDSVAFPIVSALVPAVERALQARLMRKLEPPLFAGELAGRYCNTTLGIESFVWNPGAASGRGLVARGQKPGDYPFLLQYLGTDDGGRRLRFRKLLGPEQWLPESWPGCSRPEALGQNLCPVSCFLRVLRGSGDLTVVTRDALGRFEYEGCRQEPPDVELSV